MTSSYGNVVGTPQDEIPNISDTNYLATEADMTAKVNEQIDENIKDTKDFFNDMMKIEENKQKTRDRRLEYVYKITGKLGDLYKAGEADRLDKKLNDYKYADDRKNRNEILNYTNNETSYNGLKLAEYIGNNEDTRIPEVQEILKQLNFDLDEDVDLKTFLAKYEDKEFIGSIYSSALQSLGHDSLTNVAEGVEMRKFVQQLIRNKIHVEALERGFKIDSGRYEKNLLKIVQPSIDTIASRYGYALTTQINSNLNAEQKEVLDNKIKEAVRSISISPENGQDLTTFQDTKFSLIKQISVAPTYGFNGDMAKATTYFFEHTASLLDNNLISREDASAVLDNLPYKDASSGIVYESYNAYAESLPADGKHFLRVSNNIKLLEDAIERKHELFKSEEAKTHLKLQRPYEKEATELYNAVAKRNGKVTGAEAFKILQKYYGDQNVWIPNHPIKGIKPKFITDLETATDYLGNRDVDTTLKNANLINGFDGAIKIGVAAFKDKKVGALNMDDMFLATTLKDELKASLILSADPGGKSDYEIHVDNGNDPKLFVQEKLQQIFERLENGEFDATLVVNSSKLAYQKQDLIKLHKESQGSTVDSNELYAGEAPWVEKTLLHIKSGGKLHKEVLQWWSEFKVRDTDGTFMKPRELMFRRLNALGVFKDDPQQGFFVDPRRKFMTSQEITFDDTNGLVGTMTLMSKESSITGEPMAKSILETFALPEATKGANDSKFTGTEYNYFKRNKKGVEGGIESFGYGVMNSITKGLGIDGGKVQLSDLRVFDPNDTSNLPRTIVSMAKANPDAVFGRYGITGAQLTEIFEQPAFKKYLEANPGLEFNDNFQDFLAFENIRFQLNKRNSIRGMKIERGELSVTDLTVFSDAEIEAMKEIFPRLANYKFVHLNMLSKPVADLLLTEVEKAQKLDDEQGGNKNVKALKQKQRNEKVQKFFDPINPLQTIKD